MLISPNPAGLLRTVSTLGEVDRDGPFFEPLGPNGRSCATCHVPADAWSLTPARARARFARTRGLDPLFDPIDAAGSPVLGISTLQARRFAYGPLLQRGVFRVGLPMPAGAEFTLEHVDDPYGYASQKELSLFRRPLPATNLPFLTAVMWDARHTAPGQTLAVDLAQQAADSALTHARVILSPARVDAIVRFATSLYTAQARDWRAGDLDDAGATGGPKLLSIKTLTASPDGTAFDLFSAWAGILGAHGYARRAIARGEAVFNQWTFGAEAMTCATCHDARDVGGNTRTVLFDNGTSDPSPETAGLPVYTFRCTASGRIVTTTDPGRALITGRCADLNRFKAPGLRALAARAPYFHNGSAASLEDVVAHYEARFRLGLSPEQTSDLLAFLRAL